MPSTSSNVPAEHVEEGAVRPVRDDLRIVVGDDDEARDGVRDGAREVPLALELDLATLAVGDVDPARDDADDASVLVDERGGAPRDHVLLALAFVNVFSYSLGGKSGAMSRNR